MPTENQNINPNFNPVQYAPQEGGWGSSLYDFFLGSPSKTSTTQKFTPQQQGLQSQTISQLMSLLQGGAPAGFEGIEQNARRGFNTQTLPSLAERFAGIGGLGSSGYRNSLKGAGTQLESNLAALRGQMGNQQLSSLLPHGLTSSFDTQMFNRQPGFLENLLVPLAGGIGGGIGQMGGQFAANKLGGGQGQDLQVLLMKLLPLLAAA